MARQGIYDRIPPPPVVLGFEGAGVIHSVGEGVKSLQVKFLSHRLAFIIHLHWNAYSLQEGDRVICLVDFTAQDGTWQEYTAVPEEQCFAMPKDMTFEEGAAIPVNYITAYHMLFEFGNLRPNKSVLIHMAAGIINRRHSACHIPFVLQEALVWLPHNFAALSTMSPFLALPPLRSMML
jgi:NADPH:quinone reductase-like Zn-dependent oxidoreductase